MLYCTTVVCTGMSILYSSTMLYGVLQYIYSAVLPVQVQYEYSTMAIRGYEIDNVNKAHGPIHHAVYS